MLADLPGVGDTDQNIVDLTKKYLKDAGTVLVFNTVSRIESAATNDVDNMLRECISLHAGEQRNIVMVVTGIDVKDPITDIKRLGLLPEDRVLLEKAERTLEHLKSERRTLEEPYKKAKAVKDYATSGPLGERMEELKLSIAFAAAKVKQVTIEIRNRETVETLKGKLRVLSKSRRAPDVEVHFISNQEYQKWMTGFESSEGVPCLDIEATGIPGLRRMIYSLAARGKVHTLGGIVRNLLPGTFHGIVGVLTKSKLARKESVRRFIEHRLGKCETLVKGIVDGIRAAFKDCITGTMDQARARWVDDADQLLAAWAKVRLSFRHVERRS